jgi:hypothetical protein
VPAGISTRRAGVADVARYTRVADLAEDPPEVPSLLDRRLASDGLQAVASQDLFVVLLEPRPTALEDAQTAPGHDREPQGVRLELADDLAEEPVGVGGRGVLEEEPAVEEGERVPPLGLPRSIEEDAEEIGPSQIELPQGGEEFLEGRVVEAPLPAIPRQEEPGPREEVFPGIDCAQVPFFGLEGLGSQRRV